MLYILGLGRQEGARESNGRYVFIFGGGTVSWKRKRQSVVALSSMEADNIALSEATKEDIWKRRLLAEIESGIVIRPKLVLAVYHENGLQWHWEDGYLLVDDRLDKSLVSARPQIIRADSQGCIKMSENVL